MNQQAKKEIIKIASKSLGDTIAALSAINSYSRNREIDVICKLGSELFEKSYPNIIFHPHSSQPEYDEISRMYVLNGVHYSDFKEIHYLFDKPIIQGYAEQLGVTEWDRPKIDVEVSYRPIRGKYVCFSMHSTAQCKHWNYPNAWDKLCRLLKKNDIIPICIDQHDSYGAPGNFNPIPKSALRKLGMNLKEMTNYIHHSEFFIGLSSGLSWVAHAAGKPVVMISGMTTEDNEFTDDILRIINKNVCNGCFNKPDKYPFDPSDWFWCPVYKGTKRQFECSSSISPEYVMEHIKEWMDNDYKKIELKEIPTKNSQSDVFDTIKFIMDWQTMRLNVTGPQNDTTKFTVTFFDVIANEKVYSADISAGYWIGVDPRKTKWKVEITYQGNLLKTIDSPNYLRKK